MTIAESSQRIVDSTIMTAAARLSMVLALPAIGLLFWFGYHWIEAQRTDMQHQVAAVTMTTSKTSDKLDDVNDRLVAVEAKQERDVASTARFQQEMLARQDKMQQAIVQLSNSVSALTATVRALAEAKDSRGPP